MNISYRNFIILTILTAISTAAAGYISPITNAGLSLFKRSASTAIPAAWSQQATAAFMAHVWQRSYSANTARQEPVRVRAMFNTICEQSYSQPYLKPSLAVALKTLKSPGTKNFESIQTALAEPILPAYYTKTTGKQTLANDEYRFNRALTMARFDLGKIDKQIAELSKHFPPAMRLNLQDPRRTPEVCYQEGLLSHLEENALTIRQTAKLHLKSLKLLVENSLPLPDEEYNCSPRKYLGQEKARLCTHEHVHEFLKALVEKNPTALAQQDNLLKYISKLHNSAV